MVRSLNKRRGTLASLFGLAGVVVLLTVVLAPGLASAASSTAAGKKIFVSKCATCHTLKDAKAGGTFGPNLDKLKPSLSKVEKQVKSGGGGMPSFKKQLSATQIKQVATYVHAVAGKHGVGKATGA